MREHNIEFNIWFSPTFLCNKTSCHVWQLIITYLIYAQLIVDLLRSLTTLVYWHDTQRMAWERFCVALRGRDGSCGTCPFKIKKEGTHASSNGINMLLITRPERKIYLSSPRICDQGISASVLLRDENWKWDGTMGGGAGWHGGGFESPLGNGDVFSISMCGWFKIHQLL